MSIELKPHTISSRRHKRAERRGAKGSGFSQTNTSSFDCGEMEEDGGMRGGERIVGRRLTVTVCLSVVVERCGRDLI